MPIRTYDSRPKSRRGQQIWDWVNSRLDGKLLRLQQVSTMRHGVFVHRWVAVYSTSEAEKWFTADDLPGESG